MDHFLYACTNGQWSQISQTLSIESFERGFWAAVDNKQQVVVQGFEAEQQPSLFQCLCRSAASGDLYRISVLLTHVHFNNTENRSSTTVLSRAVQSGSLDAVQMIYQSASSSLTPAVVLMALQLDQVEMLRFFISNASFNVLTLFQEDSTWLESLAQKERCYRCFDVLLSDSRFQLGLRDNLNKEALQAIWMTALRKGHLNLIQGLLRFNTTLPSQSFVVSAFPLALRHPTILQVLLQDQRLQPRFSEILRISISKNNLESFKMIVQDSRVSKPQDTAFSLVFATRFDSESILSFLLQHPEYSDRTSITSAITTAWYHSKWKNVTLLSADFQPEMVENMDIVALISSFKTHQSDSTFLQAFDCLMEIQELRTLLLSSASANNSDTNYQQMVERCNLKSTQQQQKKSLVAAHLIPDITELVWSYLPENVSYPHGTFDIRME
jgi:hypothetical protein